MNSKFKHTPGPWIISQKYGFGETYLDEITTKTAGKVIALVYTKESQFVKEKQMNISVKSECGEANARLIAAAPEMLEVLIELYPVCHREWGINFHERDKIENIIKCATGLSIEEVLAK